MWEGKVPDTLRGAAAIVGIGELKPERSRPGRDAMSLLAEAAYMAIQDAGLTKADIDGMILEEGMAPTSSGYNTKMAEYMGIFPTFATGCDAQGAAGVTMALQAAAYINAGGLGDLIFQGITQDFGEKIVDGAVLTSLLAIVADEGLKHVERRLRAVTAERL